MTIPAELHLSQAYKFAQRSFAAMLDRHGADAADVFAARTALGALDRTEAAQLGRWLAWQSLARNPQALARIERTDARLAAQVLRARRNLPASELPRPLAPWRAREDAGVALPRSA